MARRKIVGLLRPARSRADVRQQLAGASLTPGIQVRERHGREQSTDEWLREAAWSVRGSGRAPRWRV